MFGLFLFLVPPSFLALWPFPLLNFCHLLKALSIDAIPTWLDSHINVLTVGKKVPAQGLNSSLRRAAFTGRVSKNNNNEVLPKQNR